MAGRKQHFIPQHFQKPFAIKGSKERIWTYRKGNPKPIPTSISDTAAQRDFYSQPSMENVPTLDELITRYEQVLHPKVDELRRLVIGDDIPASEVAELVTHLAMRSSYMRDMVKDAASSMAEAIQAVKSGKVNGQKINFPKHYVPLAIENQIIEEFEKRKLMELTPVSGQTVAKLLYFGLREGVDDLLTDAARGIFDYFVEELKRESSSISSNAQTTILTDSLAPETRVKRLSELKWTVVEGPDGGAILPDCTSVVFDGEKWTSLFLAGIDEIVAVALPLTPDRIALGLVGGASKIDVTDFNTIAADASHTFFLSSSCKPELEQALPKLGRKVRSQLSEMSVSAMTETVEGFLAREPDSTPSNGEQDATQISWTSGDQTNLFSMSVTFFDFGDEAFCKRVADMLTSIITSFAKYLPVSGLSGFVFAHDYKAALNSIERGFEVSSEILPIEDGYQIGVGMPLTILEDGEFKTKAVLRSIVAVDLVSEDDEIRSEAIGTIEHMLASAALTRLMANKFPDKILNRIDDEYEGMLFNYTGGVFDEYFRASISCFSEKQLKLYEELAHENLFAILVQMPKLRREYKRHRDMARLFPKTSVLIQNFMIAMARLLGTMKCQNVELAEGSVLERLLSENGLLSWYTLFRNDLMSFEEGLETWAQFEEIFFVNRHYERLAFQFRLIPEPMDNGIYVHVDTNG
ncbi:MAG: DUF4238 domain-containing protein [Paracoccaceae bacterium]|nr:DUF4238 domain-containing protein [Paracoccaceae bacterium]MDE2673549.1 DUF4238 domain-containing protein [Paracoccaceae bacterium]